MRSGWLQGLRDDAHETTASSIRNVHSGASSEFTPPRFFWNFLQLSCLGDAGRARRGQSRHTFSILLTLCVDSNPQLRHGSAAFALHRGRALVRHTTTRARRRWRSVDPAAAVAPSRRSMASRSTRARTGVRRWTVSMDRRFELIVLDAALRGLDGIALCRAIRLGNINAGAAVLLVAASAAESDKIAAFTNGADDYITKPVAIHEFLARVSAVMRRASRHVDRMPPAVVERAGSSCRSIAAAGDRARARTSSARGRSSSCSMPSPRLRASSSAAKNCSPAIGPTAASKTSGWSIRLSAGFVARSSARRTNRDWILTVWGVGYKFAEPENIAEL